MEDLTFIFTYRGREITSTIKLFPLLSHQIRVEVNVTPGKINFPEMYNFYFADGLISYHPLYPEERHEKQQALARQLEGYFTQHPL